MIAQRNSTAPRGVSLALAASVICWACGDPIKDPQLIEETRVLGARVEVDGDPDRATPEPGESVTVRWLVADPGEQLQRTWAFAVCAAADVAHGTPLCVAPPFAVIESGQLALGEPSFSVTVPPLDELHDAPQLSVLGVICTEGSAHLGEDWADTYCEGSATQESLVSLDIWLQQDELSNRNPSLAGMQVRLDGNPWAETDPAAADSIDCTRADLGLPSTTAGSEEHRITFTPAAENQEPLPTSHPQDEPLEELQLQHFVTAGELERAYSNLDPTTVGSQVELLWDAPSEVGADGEVVRFYLVARDLRGGVGWTERTLCLLP